MSFLTKIWDRFRQDRHARHRGEYDAPADTGTPQSRVTGGEPSPDAPDTHSTTGTTPSGDFVGRAGGDDPGHVDDEDEPPRHRRG